MYMKKISNYDNELKMVKNTFIFILYDPEGVFSLCLECQDPKRIFYFCSFVIEIIFDMSFHGNQKVDLVAIELLKTFY